MAIQILSRYGVKPRTGGIDFLDEDGNPEVSLTKQDQAKDADINILMGKYLKHGILPMERGPGIYTDTTALPNYGEAMQIIVEADAKFQSLDPKLRNRFMNDPQELLNFIDDPANKEEAQKLGILKTPPVVKVNDPAPPVKPAPAAPAE